jgi:hypothetical protein
MNPKEFLLLNTALAFYNTGTIWAHEVDILRSWKLLDAQSFHRVQSVHWRKLPYWVFAPVALGLIGSLALLWFHPAAGPAWIPWVALTCQLIPHLLTATLWGPWQAKLSRDPRGPESPYLARILSTHWARTLFINLYSLILLAWTMRSLA